MQLFSLIWNKPTWRRSWRTVPGAQLCWHRCLRFPRWSWSPSLLLRFHLPHSSQRPPQTRAPPRSRRPPTPPRPRARPPRRAAMQTNPAQMGSHVQTMRRTPRRARLTFIVLSVKSQSTPSLSWKHITAVLSRKELAFESLSVFDLNHYKPATALSTRYKAQTDAGGSQRSASTQGESSGNPRRLQEQAAGQQRQCRGAQQELPVWSVWDLCELWDPA